MPDFLKSGVTPDGYRWTIIDDGARVGVTGMWQTLNGAMVKHAVQMDGTGDAAIEAGKRALASWAAERDHTTRLNVATWEPVA